MAPEEPPPMDEGRRRTHGGVHRRGPGLPGGPAPAGRAVGRRVRGVRRQPPQGGGEEGETDRRPRRGVLSGNRRGPADDQAPGDEGQRIVRFVGLRRTGERMGRPAAGGMGRPRLGHQTGRGNEPHHQRTGRRRELQRLRGKVQRGTTPHDGRLLHPAGSLRPGSGVRR